MQDIDYFTKSRMSEDILQYFYDNLPNERLKGIFVEAMSGTWISIYTLQHYEQTENYGVKTIKFNYEMPPIVNNLVSVLLPDVITLAWVATKKMFPNPFAYLYFDTATGKMLRQNDAHSRREQNESAERHFNCGRIFEIQQLYQQAYEEYEKAYQECSRFYVNENKFRQHRDLAKNEVDSDARISHSINAAKDFLNNGEFESARHEIMSIRSMIKSEHNRTKFNSLIEEFNKEINIRNIKIDGDDAFEERNYAKAKECYQNAFLSTNIAKMKETYKNLLISSQNEINVLVIQQEARTAFQSKNYEHAIDLLQSAIDKSKHELNRQKIREKLNHVQQQFMKHQKNETAENHFTKGKVFASKGNFESAFEEYSKACLDCSENYKNKRTFLQHRDQAKNEIDAIKMAKDAKSAVQYRNYQRAIALLKSAIKKTKHELNRQRMRRELNHVQQEFTEHKKNETAETHFARGGTFESQGLHKRAYEEYNKAYQKCSRNYVNESKFLQYRDRAKDEVDSDALIKEGEQARARGNSKRAFKKFLKALKKTHSKHFILTGKIQVLLYTEAPDDQSLKMLKSLYDRSNNLHIKSAYIPLIKQVEIELKANDKFERGKAAFEAGDYLNAKEYLSNAYSGTKNKRTKQICLELLTNIEKVKEENLQNDFIDQAFEAQYEAEQKNEYQENVRIINNEMT